MSPEDAEEYTQALSHVASGAWRQVALGHRLGVPQALGLSTGEWVAQRLGGYVRLDLTERKQAVQELTGQGMSQRQAAEVLGVGKDTVRRDLAGANAPIEPNDQHKLGPPGANAPRVHFDDEDAHWLSKGRIPPVLQFSELESRVLVIRRTLRKLLAMEAELDDEAREILEASINIARSILALVELKFVGAAQVDWDSELVKLGDDDA